MSFFPFQTKALNSLARQLLECVQKIEIKFRSTENAGVFLCRFIGKLLQETEHRLGGATL